SVRLWNVQTGREIRRFQGHLDRAGDVVFAPDAQRVLSSSTDQTLRLWDVQTGQELRRCEVGADAGWAVAISPDAQRALSVHDADVILWDLDNSRQIHRFQGQTDQVTDLAFSPDGRTAVSSSRDGSICLWGLPSGSNTAPVPQVVAQKSEPRPGAPKIQAPMASVAAADTPRPPKPAPAAASNAKPKPAPKPEAPAVAVMPTNPWFALRAVGESGSALNGVLGLGAPRVCSKDRSLGTALTWANSPSEAFDQAKAEGKLVMLLHVSGNFEDSGFT
ncbi:MAG TPA: hypothetical protein VFT74_00660, partial [Isosphaeraceae bacterium]|nr:hypothetical protein [Isosphaeraceae bacterium]